MHSYTIGEVARRSGFAPATLRYYDDIGLLRPDSRSGAGYRRYSDRDLERLRFVARAKQLGCTLDEIADLLTAWDGGECGPLQDRLRSLVDEKITDAQTRLVELAALLDDLQRAVDDLGHHRPDGPCDDTCGCITAPDATADPQFVHLGRRRDGGEAPIACSLPADQMPDRLAAFHAVGREVLAREPIDDGIRLALADPDIGALAELLRAEQRCCPFWQFAITVDERGVGLEVRGPDDAMALVDTMFGAPA